MTAHTSAIDDQVLSNAAAFVEVDIGPPMRGGFPHRVIPAIVGGLFAGLLLVGLGCTPFFGGQKTRAGGAESGQVVHASKQAGLVVNGGATQTPAAGAGVSPAPSKNAAAATPKSAAMPTSKSAASSGVAAVAASSASTGGVASSASTAAHSFRVYCEPGHGVDDASAPRPETVALQGIMAGRNTKSALLNGVLYREGDAFGSAACPWIVAMIDPAGVRIEKSFGDRVCGVTIALQNRTASAKAK